MLKTTRKFTALLLSLIMILSLAVTAFGNETVTESKATEAQVEAAVEEPAEAPAEEAVPDETEKAEAENESELVNEDPAPAKEAGEDPAEGEEPAEEANDDSTEAAAENDEEDSEEDTTVAETVTETETETETVVDPVEEPTTEPAPVEEGSSEIETEPVSETTAEAETETTAEPTTETPTTVEPTTEAPTTEAPTTAEPTTEPTTEAPTEEPETEPVVENAITVQPQDFSVCAYDTANFSVETTGEVSSYRWEYSTNGKKWYSVGYYSGRSANYSFIALKSDNNCQFRVKVTFADKTTVTSAPAKLKIVPSSITENPQDLTVAPGEKATFTVGLNGTASNVQWQVSENGKRWSNLSRYYYGNTTTLNFIAEAEDDGLLVRAVVSARDGKKLTSEAAKLTVAEEISYPAQDFSTTVGDMTVAVEAPEGAFSENVIFTANEADNAQAATALENENVNVILSMDISFYDGDIKVQPQKDVNVLISTSGLSDVKEPKLFHISDDGEVDCVTTFAINEEGLHFTASSFSEYVLADAADGTPVIKAAGTRAAGDPVIAAGKSVTDNDHDGIYELALTVTGQADSTTDTKIDKSNVILVIDVSGSMDTNVWSQYTYDATTYSDSAVYRTEANGQAERVYHDDDGWYYLSGYWNPERITWTGNVYVYETRMDATKRAACKLVDTLLENNDPSDEKLKDVIEISVVKFASLEEEEGYTGGWNSQYYHYNGTETIVSKSYDATAIKTAINELTSGGGTNWAAALKEAKTEADTKYKPEEGQKTSIIFLTDGLPTLYLNSSETAQAGNGQETDPRTTNGRTNVSNSFNGAKPYARSILYENNQETGYTLYSIIAFNNETGTGGTALNGSRTLNNLTRYAYTGATGINWNTNNQPADEHFFNASNTTALEEAFDTISHSIQNTIGYAGVSITDGVSLGATNTSLTVSGTIDTSSMRYTVSKNTTLYEVHIEDGTATFTIYGDGDPVVLVDNEATTSTITIGSDEIAYSLYEVEYNGKKYQMAPATIDADGMVQWNLAGLGILEDGVTYKLAFDVWANQTAYDIAADLNNKIYTSVEDALAAYGFVDDPNDAHDEYDRIKSALHHNEDGSYSIETNYHQQVDFYPATSHTEEGGGTTWEYGSRVEQPITQPPAIPLEGSSLPLEKVWAADLMESELESLLYKADGTPTEYGITLHVWKAESEAALEEAIAAPVSDSNKPYQSYDLGWDATENKYIWDRAMAVAPGMLVNLHEAQLLGFDVTDTSKIVSFTPEATEENPEPEVQDYYIVENGHYYYVTEERSDLHFELITDIYHPMIVDGKLFDLTIEGSTVTEKLPMGQVIATNYLKGGLNIDKVVSSTQIGSETAADGTVTLTNVTAVENCEDEFAFKITLWKVDKDNAIQPVYTYDDQFNADNTAISGSIGYRELGKITNAETGDRETLGRNVIVFEDSVNAAAKIEANKRGTNEPVYAAKEGNKTVIILKVPANGEIRIVNLPAGTQYTVEEIVDESGAYNFAGIGSYVKPEEEAPTTFGTTNNVSGQIHRNEANVETFYNWSAFFYVYHSSNNAVEKISFSDQRVNGTYANGEYSYTFNIAKEAGHNSKDTEIYAEENEDGSYSFTEGDYLYGGYFNAFSGKAATDDQIRGKAETGNLTFTENWASDSNGTAYTADTKGVWTRADANKTVAGTAMEVEVNGVYIVKEVPIKYLRNKIYYVYDYSNNDEIEKLFLATPVDDQVYKEVGFTVDNYAKGRVYASFTFSQRGTTKTEKIQPTSFADVVQGYVGILSDIPSTMIEIKTGNKFTVTANWKTMDGVIVNGVPRSFIFNNTRNGGLAEQ